MRFVRDWLATAPAAALAAALAVVVIGAGLFGFAIAELTSDDASDGGPTESPAQAPAVVGGSTQGGGQVAGWPAQLSAYTVVIARRPDFAGARRAARDARRGGLDAGVLQAARHGLARVGNSEGAWLAYTGTFASRSGAQRLAKSLAVRYPGARVELVQSSQ
jgi:hypothetical protein